MGRSLKLSVRCLSIVLPKWPIKRFQPVRQSRQQAPVLWHFAMDDPVRSYCPNIYTVIKGQKWKLHFPRILCWITRNDVSKAQVWLWNRSQFKLAKIRVCNAYLLVYIIIINFPTGSSMARCHKVTQYFWWILKLDMAFNMFPNLFQFVSFCSNNLLWPQK